MKIRIALFGEEKSGCFRCFLMKTSSVDWSVIPSSATKTCLDGEGPGIRLTLGARGLDRQASMSISLRQSRHDAPMYERLIHKFHFARFGPAGTLETVRKGPSPRSRIKQRRTRQEGRPLVPLLQNRDRRWPRAISRRRRRRSTIHPSSTPWIATRNVSTQFLI